MQRLILKTGRLYLALMASMCGILLSQSAHAASELIANGSFNTLQGWQSTSVSLKKDQTNYARCQHNGSNDSQCPLKGNKTLACLQSNSLSNQPESYANTYLRQRLASPLLPNTRYRFSFKALRPITTSTTNTGPATLLSSIATNNDWPMPDKTYANWKTNAPSVVFSSNNTLLNTTSNYGSGFYLFAQAQTMEFVTPYQSPTDLEPATINFTYIPGANNNEGICITDISLQQIPTPDVNGPKVAVNTYGYLTDAPKQATFSNLPSKATMWQLISEFENTTIVRKQGALPILTLDKDSGDILGIADFSDYTGTSIDPRFRVRIVDSIPYCQIGTYDGKDCLIQTPASTTPSTANGNLYHSVVRCPLSLPGTYFDGANCFVAITPSGTRPFIYNSNLYYTPLSGGRCPLNGSWFDGANCFVATPPPGTTPFIYNGNLYHTQSNSFCPTNTSFDGSRCLIAKVPAGTSPFVSSNKLFVTASIKNNLIVQSELFRIGQRSLYNPLKKDALFSFYHQRSNEKIESYADGFDLNATWKNTIGKLFHDVGTPTDETVGCYSGIDLHGNVWPGCDNRRFNVSKGWYDAADHGKYVVNGGISVWTLQNLAERLQAKGTLNNAFPAGMMNFQSSHNSYSDLLTEARNEMEFLLSMQIAKGQGITMSVPVGYQAKSATTGLTTGTWTPFRPTEGVYQVKKVGDEKQYANNSVPGTILFNNGQLPILEIALKLTNGVDVGGMVFHSVTDRCWTGIPTNPADYSVDCTNQKPNTPKIYPSTDADKRVLTYPTTAATLNLAATAAQCYRVWKNVDAAFANRCLQAGKDAWDAAVRIRRDYGDIFRYEYQNTPNDSSSWKNSDNGKNLNTLVYGFALSPNFSGGGNYGDLRLRDEYYWAGMELYLATKDINYLTNAESFIRTGALATDDRGRKDYDQSSDSDQKGFPIQSYNWINGFNWQNVAALGSISALVADPATFKVTDPITIPGLTGTRISPLTNLLDRAKTIVGDQIDRSGKPSYKTPSAAYDPNSNNTNLPWGSNGEILNRVLILALASEYAIDATEKANFRNGVTAAMNYLLGNNPLQRSYISGYGANALSNPHHRFFAKNATFGWATIPPGFIAGGPNTRDVASVVAGATRNINGEITAQSDISADYFLNTTFKKCSPDSTTISPMRCYSDDWRDFASNEIAINWQAPLVWISQYLSEAN